MSALVVTAVISGFELENLAAGIAANAKGFPGAAAGTFLGGTTFLALGVAGVGGLIAPIRVRLPSACCCRRRSRRCRHDRPFHRLQRGHHRARQAAGARSCLDHALHLAVAIGSVLALCGAVATRRQVARAEGLLGAYLAYLTAAITLA